MELGGVVDDVPGWRRDGAYVKASFWDFLRLTFVVIFVNYFCLQNLLTSNRG